MKITEIKNLYNSRVKQNGIKASSVGWRSWKQQELRFKIMLSDLDIKSSDTVLDLGCGFSCLLDFIINLKVSFKIHNYTGIDISSEMITHSRNKYPQANFIIKDFFLGKKNNFCYDWIFCSGALNLKIEKENKYKLVENFIKNNFSCCKKGLSFNLIHDDVDYRDKNLQYYNSLKIHKIVSNYSNFYAIKRNYNLREMTVIIFKSNYIKKDL